MPKLGLDALPDEMRQHIIELQNFKLIDITEYKFAETKKFKTSDIMKWDDTDVRDYYLNELKEDVVEQYDAIIEKEKKDLEERAKRDAEYKASRPSAADPEYRRRRTEIRLQRLDEEEEQEKLKELEEELEYKQLLHDAKEAPLSDDDFLRFDKLNDKYGVNTYSDEKEVAIDYEKQIAEKDNEIRKYMREVKPKRPTGFQKFVDSIYHWARGKHTAPVEKYNGLAKLQKEKTALERRAGNARSEMERVQEMHKEFNYAENSMKREERILNQAKNIVIKNHIAQAKEKGQEPTQLTKNEINAQAREVIKSDAFKNTVKILDAGTNDVSPSTFFNRFNVELNRLRLMKHEPGDGPKQETLTNEVQKTNQQKPANPEVTNGGLHL